MHFQTLPLFLLAPLLATAQDTGNNNNNNNFDDGQWNPDGAAAIEGAVTSYLSASGLPPNLESIAPQLSSAGVTGIIFDTTSLPTSTYRPDDDDDKSSRSTRTRTGTRTSDGMAPATGAPQVFMQGAMGAVGAYVLAEMF